MRTRRIPAARQAASTAALSLASAPVWEAAARAPASLPPAARSTTGVPDSVADGSGARERAAVAEVLAVDADDARVLVLGECADEIGRLEVGLVAERGEAGDAEPVVAGERAHLEREVAALREQPEPSRRELVHAEVERRRRVDDAEAVGAEQHRPRGADALDHAPLDLPAARRRSSPRPAVMPTIARAPAASDASTASSNAAAGSEIATSSGDAGKLVERAVGLAGRGSRRRFG